MKTSWNVKLSQKRLSIIAFKALAIFLLVVIVLPYPVFASEIYSQLLHDVSERFTYGSGVSQIHDKLGTGYSGWPGSVSLLLGSDNGSDDDTILLDIQQCDDNTYSTGCTVIFNSRLHFFDIGVDATNVLPVSVYTWSSTTPNHPFIPGVAIDPTKYLQIGVTDFEGHAGARHGEVYGTVDGNADVYCANTCTSGMHKLFWYFDTDPGVTPDTDVTRFISTQPVASTTVATTTTIGAHLFINSKDYVNGMYLSMSYTNQTVSLTGGSALDAWNSAFGVGEDIRIPLPTFGDISTSTTFTFPGPGGKTTATYRLVSPSFTSSLLGTLPLIGSSLSGLLPANTVLSKKFQFTIGALTPLDVAVAQGGGSIVDFLTTGTTTRSVLKCNPSTSFSLEACLVSLIIPDETILQGDLVDLQNGFLSREPIGFVSRFFTVLTDGATTTLPDLNYTMASTSPLGAANFHFSPWQYMSFSTSSPGSVLPTLTDPATGKNLWQIVQPFYTYIIWLMVLFQIITRLIKIHPAGNEDRIKEKA
jgi:hypothetical protein